MGSTAAGHKFGFNDAWFDSRGQAVWLFRCFCISLKVLSLAILGWKACHDCALHWRKTHRHTAQNENIGGDFHGLRSRIVNSVHWKRVVSSMFHLFRGMSKHNVAFLCDALHPGQTHTALRESSKVASRWQCHPGVRTRQHRGFKICTWGVHFDQTNERQHA